jgi:tRNA threonylcarbamoyl adenosine modification protein YeaZ
MILAIDTSTIRASVAVLDEGRVLFGETFIADRTHSVELFAILERALKIAPLCDQVVIGLGPGSYSGIRIAISAAIGLGLGMKAQLTGIPSIVAIETDAPEYLTVGDARRGTFYYAHVSNRECIERPTLLTPEELVERFASHKALPVLASAPLAETPSAVIAFPSAEILARLAEQGRSISARDVLEPIYLRAPHITNPKHSAR